MHNYPAGLEDLLVAMIVYLAPSARHPIRRLVFGGSLLCLIDGATRVARSDSSIPAVRSGARSFVSTRVSG